MELKLNVPCDSASPSSDELLRVARDQREELQSDFRDSGAIWEATKTGCIAFKLRFISTKNLELFKLNLDSGLLTSLIKHTLIKGGLKTRDKADEFRISLTIFDSWEYEMCQMELTSLQCRNNIFAIFRRGGSRISQT